MQDGILCRASSLKPVLLPLAPHGSLLGFLVAERPTNWLVLSCETNYAIVPPENLILDDLVLNFMLLAIFTYDVK